MQDEYDFSNAVRGPVVKKEANIDSGSTFKVPLTTIREILPHNNAEKLEVAVVYGFQVVVRKDHYKVGDKVYYIPVDSILPQVLEDQLFPPNSKIKLNKHRIRQIRIRGLASQGMLMDPKEVTPEDLGVLEHDYASFFGITKYEPPENFMSNVGKPGGRKIKKDENPLFHKYNGLDNIKWYPDKFKLGENVVIQEKIHGTNARAALMPYVANTLWRKIKKYFGFTPAYEFCYGSNNVQLQQRDDYTGFYGEDVYGKVFEKCNIKDKLKEGETIYGEIYGSGIQKGYSYGLTEGEHRFILFDVKVLNEDGTQRWLSPDEVNNYAKERGFDVVPEVYRGPYLGLEHAKNLTIGDSILAPEQKIREGVVVKSLDNYDEFGNKRALKVISEAYLDNPENTDFH